MKKLGLTLAEALAFLAGPEGGPIAAGAALAGLGGQVLAGVSTDSRTVAPGELFVALAGPRFDGHDHLATALEKGALAVLVQRPLKGLARPAAERAVVVSDALAALGDLALGLRLRQKIRVVAVTGSNGKTSVKEMLAAILGRKAPVLATAGNFNNLVGLPLTLFRLEKAHRLAVLEMGMNRFGEIARLTEIARPDVGLITSVGPAHLEFFGQVEKIAKAKGELYRGLDPAAVAVVNIDEPLLVAEARRFGGNKLSFGRSPEAQVRLKKWRSLGLEGQSFVIQGPGAEKGLEARLRLLGGHNAVNALAAAAAALAAGADWADIIEGLAEIESYPGRLSALVTPAGPRLIDDSYNANPASVEAGLRVLAGLPGRAPKGAILGDMLELGARSPFWHRRVGALCAEMGLDFLAAVGPLSKNTARAAVAAGMPKKHVAWFAGPEEAADWAAAWSKRSRILIKGSRGLALEKAVNHLRGL